MPQIYPDIIDKMVQETIDEHEKSNKTETDESIIRSLMGRLVPKSEPNRIFKAGSMAYYADNHQVRAACVDEIIKGKVLINTGDLVEESALSPCLLDPINKILDQQQDEIMRLKAHLGIGD